VNFETAKKILQLRLNMCKLPGNYKSGNKGECGLCEEGEGSTECKQVISIRKVWEVKVEDLESQEIQKMKDVQ
jgi:hypothetical protein